MAVNKVIYDGRTIVDLTGDTVTPEKMLSGATAHDKSGAPIEGTIPTFSQALFIKPTTSDQGIPAGVHLGGGATVRGDEKLLPENIKSGVSIFDVLGTFEGEGGGLPSGISAIATGTVTPASDTMTLIVNHNLGVRPNFAAYVVLGDYSTFAKKGAAYASFFYRPSGTSIVLSEKTLSFFYDPTTGTFDSSAQKLNSTQTTTSGQLVAATEGSFLQGREYFWIVAKIDNAL